MQLLGFYKSELYYLASLININGTTSKGIGRTVNSDIKEHLPLTDQHRHYYDTGDKITGGTSCLKTGGTGCLSLGTGCLGYGLSWVRVV